VEKSFNLSVSEPQAFVELCKNDGEFMLAARYWNGGIRLLIPGQEFFLTLKDGQPSLGDPGDAEGVISVCANENIWQALLAPVPPRFFNDLQPATAFGLEIQAEEVLLGQYYAALMRAVELLRPGSTESSPLPDESKPVGTIDAPIGRYVHLDILGQDYRVYFEEAGQGIPILLQHTAGCHGTQWRHLMENTEITKHFRLIAYDLPFHGKSIPPVGQSWWTEEYKLTAEFVRAVPVALTSALELNSPVFMGCSVGGVLALDLARYYPDVFRAVISLEGALTIPTDISELGTLWHPQVSNEFKARAMNGLMSPTSPEAYRKETSMLYAAGWPALFLGDLHYYMTEFDLTKEAANIDTSKVAVHILSGEYDYSGPIELGKAAHKAIPGSTWTGMDDVGHFPMSENPEKFLEYLMPVLDIIKGQ